MTNRNNGGLVKVPGYALKELNGNGVLVDQTTNKLIHLNEAGVMIWKLLDVFSPGKIIGSVAAATGREVHLVEGEVGALLGKLESLGAIIFGKAAAKEGAKDLFDTYVLAARRRRALFSAVCELTHRCNFKCRHCYVPSAGACRAEELSTREWLRTLNGLDKAGVFSLLFTGGEPFMRPDFKEIYLHAKSKGFHISLYTNGYFLPPDVLPFLAKYPPVITAITLYGATDATYRAFTSASGAWDKVTANIRLLKKLGLNLKLRTQASLVNRGELDRMRDFAAENGIPFSYRTTICPPAEGKENAQCWGDICLTPAGVARAEYADPDKRAQRRAIDTQAALLLKTSPYSEIPWHCGAGVTSCLISPEGVMTPCVQLRKPAYDLKKTSVASAWRKMAGGIRAELKKSAAAAQAKKCSRCEKITQCDYCPAWVLRAGEPGFAKFTDNLCEVAEERSKIFPAMGIKKLLRRRVS